MADEYVPTTDVVRDAVTFPRRRLGEPRDMTEAAFDRWLAEVREQIAREIDARASQADSEDYTGGPAYTSGVRYGLTIAAAIAGGAS